VVHGLEGAGGFVHAPGDRRRLLRRRHDRGLAIRSTKRVPLGAVPRRSVVLLAAPVSRVSSGSPVQRRSRPGRGPVDHANRGSKYYHLALTTSDGVVDTIELQGSDRQLLWNESKAQVPVMVQRFRDTDTGPAHVTVVTREGSIAKTEWNPAWRADDAVTGVVFLSLAAVGALIGLVAMRAWQRRDVTPTLASRACASSSPRSRSAARPTYSRAAGPAGREEHTRRSSPCADPLFVRRCRASRSLR
jgi:hypothetical protein